MSEPIFTGDGENGIASGTQGYLELPLTARCTTTLDPDHIRAVVRAALANLDKYPKNPGPFWESVVGLAVVLRSEAEAYRNRYK